MTTAQRNAYPKIKKCEHDGARAGTMRLVCTCPCVSCWDSSAPLGERCQASNHCTAHFLSDGQRRDR
jgi:hypothetical protein